MPYGDNLVRLSRALGCTATDLLEGFGLGDLPDRWRITERVQDANPQYDAPPPSMDLDAWSEIRALIPRLCLIYEARTLATHAERWGWIKGNIHTFSDLVKNDVEAWRKGRREKRARDAER